LEKLKIKQIDIFYIHAPDRSLTLDKWVPTVQKLYEEGVFKRFGISNFAPEEVQDLHAYCKKNNLVLPIVYQGNYSAIARNPEKSLFPVLRALNISFYAYSPLAGGFLTKTRQGLIEGVGQGKWAKNSPTTMYKDM
jgi:aryl-alcohol dehydrogenase-like predicted oxidoreductase